MQIEKLLTLKRKSSIHINSLYIKPFLYFFFVFMFVLCFINIYDFLLFSFPVSSSSLSLLSSFRLKKCVKELTNMAQKYILCFMYSERPKKQFIHIQLSLEGVFFYTIFRMHAWNYHNAMIATITIDQLRYLTHYESSDSFTLESVNIFHN